MNTDKKTAKETRKEYKEIIYVPSDELALINKFLQAENESQFQGEDDTISYTAQFPNGIEMDIKCCGCNDAPSWTEAVLFNERGGEIACSDVWDYFEGTWELELENTLYCVEVKSLDCQ